MEWDDYDVFCHVIDHGSFTAAARVLGRPKSSVSAAVAKLEARLKVRLIERTTRRLRPTEAGEALHRELTPLFGHLREVASEARARGSTIGGTLRIAAPYEFGAHHLGAVACKLLAAHPGLEIDIAVEHAPVNLFDQKYDIVFAMADKELAVTGRPAGGVMRRMISLERGVFAAPALIAACGQAAKPADLARLPLLAAPSDAEWIFTDRRGGETVVPIVEPRLRSSNAGIRLQAALAGLGVARITATYCEPAVRSGQLIRLLPGVVCAPLRVYALLPARRLMPAKVRLFIDTLAAAAKAGR
jgi:DNA-binding transcriptional LysR family regulator